MSIINLFQEQMKTLGYTAYIVPTSDFHNSEYVSSYFKVREYLSGFTGSAGTLVILENNSYLWTDGRYYIQAAKQIEGKNIELMKSSAPGVPSIAEFLNSKLKDDDVLGFDGRVLSTSFVFQLQNTIKAKIKYKTDIDLINRIWTDRPELPFSLLFKLDNFFSGKEYEEKIEEVREELKKHNSEIHILTALEDQAWLYNLRGNDVKHTPVFLAYTIITLENVYLFINPNKIDITIEKYLDENSIIVRPYNDIYEFLKSISGKNITMDYSKANYQIYSLVANTNNVSNLTDPTLILKSIKNSTEIKNIKLAHINDGVAVTKFMHYIKENYKNNLSMSEISLSDYLKNLRMKTDGFIDLSFDTICAFNEHAAMMHYSPTIESNAIIDKPGFLLVDSGGHYLDGTTDITRTFALGNITEEMKIHFTTVLKSVIALSQAVFLKGCNGINLDILARGPIWKLLIDYKCGTGHGVGYLLSVHEAPNGFRWQIVPERNDSAKFVSGMITTNEPGIYLENRYGIRIENEMLCVEKGSSEFGEFLGFETITYAPIDLDAIKVELLNQEEKDWLNNYHKEVYDKLSKFLSEDECLWLKEYTKEI